ncbi:MAG: metal-dependent hydrolase [bacterium]|nr:metal-dependent hydrolase [bacterium]
MDPLAHTLTGITLANAGLKQRVGPGCMLALILASNIVDVDIFGTFFLDLPSWTFRRMWTHSFIMAPALAIFAAVIFRRLYPNASFFTWLWIFLLGAGAHIFMDLINSYGVVLFFPFSMQRFELAWVFIIDLYIWGILLLALLSPYLFKKLGREISMRTSAQIGICLLIIYISLCGILRQRSMHLLEQHGLNNSAEYSFHYVFPEPFSPWHFRGVLRDADEYHVHLIKPLSGLVTYVKTYKTDEHDPEVAKLIDSANGKRYQWFFKAPVWEKQSSEMAIVSDLRFKSLLLNREAPFTYLVTDDSKLGLRP